MQKAGQLQWGTIQCETRTVQAANFMQALKLDQPLLLSYMGDSAKRCEGVRSSRSQAGWEKYTGNEDMPKQDKRDHLDAPVTEQEVIAVTLWC